MNVGPGFVHDDMLQFTDYEVLPLCIHPGYSLPDLTDFSTTDLRLNGGGFVKMSHIPLCVEIVDIDFDCIIVPEQHVQPRENCVTVHVHCEATLLRVKKIFPNAVYYVQGIEQ